MQEEWRALCSCVQACGCFGIGRRRRQCSDVIFQKNTKKAARRSCYLCASCSPHCGGGACRGTRRRTQRPMTASQRLTYPYSCGRGRYLAPHRTGGARRRNGRSHRAAAMEIGRWPDVIGYERSPWRPCLRTRPTLTLEYIWANAAAIKSAALDFAPHTRLPAKFAQQGMLQTLMR